MSITVWRFWPPSFCLTAPRPSARPNASCYRRKLKPAIRSQELCGALRGAHSPSSAPRGANASSSCRCWSGRNIVYQRSALCATSRAKRSRNRSTPSTWRCWSSRDANQLTTALNAAVAAEDYREAARMRAELVALQGPDAAATLTDWQQVKHFL